MKVAAPRIGLLLAIIAMTGCGGSGGDTNETSNTVDPGPTAGKLTLSGLVTDDPIVNADIMFKVGNTEFPSNIPTGSLGEFQVEIESEDLTALVVGSAFDSANNVRLTAVLDTFEGCLDLAQNNIVNNVKITNITTAQQVLAERLALDGSVDDYQEFVELLPQIDAQELLELSSAIKVVVENINGMVLPAGTADTLELARTIADGSSNFLNDLEVVSPGTLEQAQDKLLSDGNATIEFAAAQAPGVYRGVGDEYIYAVFENGSALVEFFDDNVVSGTPSWQITDSGKLRVNFYGFDRESDALTLMSDNGSTLHVVTEFVDNSGQDAGQLAATVSKFGFGEAFDSSSVVGSFTDPRNSQNTLVIETGGTGYSSSAGASDQPFNWSIDDKGALVIDFANNDFSLELINLDSAADPMVLSVTRFGGQSSSLIVGAWGQ